MTAPAHFIGLISGTSADAIDAALVAVDGTRIETRATHTHPFSEALHAALARALAVPDALTVPDFGRLDAALGDAFADAALAVTEAAGLAADDVTAIGSHGQTLYHAPGGAHAFTLQAGDAARIAARTRITTVADFRRADVAAGGEGAPLAPLLHAALLASPDVPRAVVNLGGIANVTLLVPGAPVLGFDTGPANTLMDRWAALTGNGAFDAGGRLAAAGNVDETLLAALADDPFFARPAPKSTGREHFDTAWLLGRLGLDAARAARLQTQRVADIMATLCALTARTVAHALRDPHGKAPLGLELIACGGGCHNPELMRRLSEACAADATTTADHGIDPDFVEAILFAWLAAKRLAGEALDTRTITGARHPVMAGSVHEAAPG